MILKLPQGKNFMSKVTDVWKKRRRVYSIAGITSGTRQRSSPPQGTFRQPFIWSWEGGGIKRRIWNIQPRLTSRFLLKSTLPLHCMDFFKKLLSDIKLWLAKLENSSSFTSFLEHMVHIQWKFWIMLNTPSTLLILSMLAVSNMLLSVCNSQEHWQRFLRIHISLHWPEQAQGRHDFKALVLDLNNPWVHADSKAHLG